MPVEKINTYRHELREKILKTATKAFSEQGIRKVKMDDIASALSISKRTVYELYVTKEDLLLQCFIWSTAEQDKQFRTVAELNDNAMDILINILRIRMEQFRVISPLFIEELARYPQIISYINDNRKRKVETIIKFFERGVEEGYFMPNCNYHLILEVLDGIESSVVQKKLLAQYTLEDVYLSMLLVVLRGICTPKGIEILDRFLEHEFPNK